MRWLQAESTLRSPWGLSRRFSATSIAVKPSTFVSAISRPKGGYTWESQGLEFCLKLMTDTAYTTCYTHKVVHTYIYLSIDGCPLAVEVSTSGKSPVSNLNLWERQYRLMLLTGQ